jgi:hypothetical protein
MHASKFRAVRWLVGFLSVLFGGALKRVEFRHTAVWIHRRVSYSIRRSQAAHCELDLSVWPLPPMLNNRHITAMRNLIDDFACLEASRFYR